MGDRVGIGCMRMTDANADAIVDAALEEGITIFDTARAYGESERSLGRALRTRDAFVITKGGMREGWRPDGRARSLREDCEKSLEELGRPIDLYLVHAPDPNVDWAVTIRGLAKLLELGLVRAIGVSNVNRKQLDEAIAIAPIAGVEVALGASSVSVRAGVVARCAELGIPLYAHSPFGGPVRAPKWAKHAKIRAIANRHGASAHEVVLAATKRVHDRVVPIPGATRAETVRSIARGARLVLADDEALDVLGISIAPPKFVAAVSPARVVLVMGMQGSGKSTIATALADHERFNRDLHGGTLDQVHRLMGEAIDRGVKKIVLDNTYTTRVMRHGAIKTARERGAHVHGQWIDVSMPDAQINVILRMLEAHGRLLEPHEMERAKDPTRIAPNVLFRTQKAMEPPSMDEGFSSLETIPFVRTWKGKNAARFVSIEAAKKDASLIEGSLLFGWNVKTDMPAAICMHPAGPPRCWCRPPLPGLLLDLARKHDIDFRASTIVGTSPAHRAMASALGTHFVQT